MLKIIITNQKYYEDYAAKQIVERLKNDSAFNDSIIYYEFPTVSSFDEEATEPSLLLIDKIKGVNIINICANNSVADYEQIFEKLVKVSNNLYSKILKGVPKHLRNKKELVFVFNTILLSLQLDKTVDDMEDVIATKSIDDLIEIIKKPTSFALEDEDFNKLQAIIEGSPAIIKAKNREVSDNDKTSKAYILKIMEGQIALLDMEQKKAAIAQINGPQRIRGLAGSGKTIILCLKAALIHLKYPNKKILYTFMTKSLYDLIEKMIIRFYKYYSDGEMPNFDYIKIKHAWGGSHVSGVYADAAIDNGYVPKDYSTVKSLSKIGIDIFDYVCKELLENTNGSLKKAYDFVLIDEAQDFKPSFYQICRELVFEDCLVWCYDDLQNIFDVAIQDTNETFKNNYGKEGINLEELKKHHEDLDNDVVLEKTYRNPKEILVLAHAIGFGIYNDKIIQKLESNSHWEQFGYTVRKGECATGDSMEIFRNSENSPLIISEKQKPDEMIIKKSFDNLENEINWVCDEIINNIEVDLLKPEDIVVISLDDINSRLNLALISAKLAKRNIETFNLSSNYYLKGFTKEGAVTLSTLYKAKGNEAAMIYVINSDVFNKRKNSVVMRNKIFTAFTRAKGWLRISGIDCDGKALFNEIEDVFKNNFEFKFIQPNEAKAIKGYKGKKKASPKEVLEYKQLIKKFTEMGLTDEDIFEITKSGMRD